MKIWLTQSSVESKDNPVQPGDDHQNQKAILANQIAIVKNQKTIPRQSGRNQSKPIRPRRNPEKSKADSRCRHQVALVHAPAT